MGRSLKKGPYVDEKLLKKILKAKEEKSSKAIKTWARACVITPDMVNARLGVYNGKNFIEVIINERMIGRKLGEFAITRTFTGHSKKGKIAKSTGSTGRVLKD